ELAKAHRAQVPVLVGDGSDGVHALREADALLQRFGDLLVVLPISGRGLDALAIEKSDAAPAVDQRLEIRCLAARCRAAPLRADRAAMLQELVENAELLRIEVAAQRCRVAFGAETLVTFEQLLDLLRVVGHELRGRIDRR